MRWFNEDDVCLCKTCDDIITKANLGYLVSTPAIVQSDYLRRNNKKKEEEKSKFRWDTTDPNYRPFKHIHQAMRKGMLD